MNEVKVKYFEGYYRIVISPVPRDRLGHSRGQSGLGYGRKISTDYLLITNTFKKRRVYAVCFSNVASHYVIDGNETLYLRDGELQDKVEQAREKIKFAKGK